MPPGLERVAAASRRFKTVSRDLDAARREMREAISEAYAEGCSIREIAAVAGLSPSRVHQIVTDRK